MIPVILFTKAVLWGAGVAASTATPVVAGTGAFFAGATLVKAKVAVNDGLSAVDPENRPIQLLPGEILQLLAHDETWEGPEICLPGGRSIKDAYPDDTPEVIYARARARAKKYAYFIRKGLLKGGTS
jgi:hypothetical protein